MPDTFYSKNTLSKSNQCLLDENVSLKNELNHTKQVVDQLQSSSDSKYLDQIDSLRAENKILNQKFTETKLTNAELEAQVEIYFDLARKSSRQL